MNPRTGAITRIPAMSDTRELARILGIPATELVNRRRAGCGPRAVKIGREYVYLRNHVYEWLAEVVSSTAPAAQTAG